MGNALRRHLGLYAAVVACGVLAAVGGAAAHASGGNVPCSGPGGGAAGLVAAVTAANASGGGGINLASGCTYALTRRTTPFPASARTGCP